MADRWATTTSYRPDDGRMIALPAGCVGVLYVFEDREQAVAMSDGGEVVALTGTVPGVRGMAIDPDSGESWRTD